MIERFGPRRLACRQQQLHHRMQRQVRHLMGEPRGVRTQQGSQRRIPRYQSLRGLHQGLRRHSVFGQQATL